MGLIALRSPVGARWEAAATPAVDADTPRANLKLSAHLFLANSQQFPSEWHPSVDIEEPESAAPLLSFLARHRPQLERLGEETVRLLLRGGPGVVQHILLPCCREHLAVLHLQAWPDTVPLPPLGALCALRELHLAGPAAAAGVLPAAPPGLTYLSLTWRKTPCHRRCAARRRLAALREHRAENGTACLLSCAQQPRAARPHVLMRPSFRPRPPSLQGGLPDLSALPALGALVLSACPPPLPLAALPHGLTRLNLGQAALEAVPPQLSAFTALREFALSGPPLAAGFEHLPPSLTSLGIGECALRALPVQITALTQLRQLWLEACAFDEGGFEHLPPSVTSLDLAQCSLSALARLTGLRRLWAVDCPLEGGAGFEHLPPSVTTLNVMDCGLAAVPPALARMTALQKLWAGGCPLAEGFEHLPSSLTFLLLDDTGLEAVPPALAALTGLRQLSLNRCPLGGGPGGLEAAGLQHVPPSVTLLQAVGCGVEEAAAAAAPPCAARHLGALALLRQLASCAMADGWLASG
eukprot:scaffold14.g1049.t1